MLIKKQAKKALQSVPQPDRSSITEKLDIKKLQGEPYFRLRVGQWRVIFDRDPVEVLTNEPTNN